MYTECLLAEPELNMYGTAMSTSVSAAPLAGAVMVEDRFATLPGLIAVASPSPTPTYRPFDEEELHTSFEEAISDRVLAVKHMLSLQSNGRVTTGLLSADWQSTPFIQAQVTPAVEQEVVDEQPRKKPLSLLSNNRWLRGITYGSFVLMLMLVGFDLMGMLVLFHR